jgi:putative FmdB family regulatory protein
MRADRGHCPPLYSAGFSAGRTAIFALPLATDAEYAMPIYEYHCRHCSAGTEKLQKISDPPLSICPQCGEPQLQRKISAAAFRLKGGGWYETDFKKNGKKNLAGDTAAPAAAPSAAATPAPSAPAAAGASSAASSTSSASSNTSGAG